MATYTVHLTQAMSTSVEVEAEDEQAAIEAAYESEDMAPGSICAHCSGWGQSWSVDTAGDWEPIEVEDADGNVVWSDRPQRTEES